MEKQTNSTVIKERFNIVFLVSALGILIIGLVLAIGGGQAAQAESGVLYVAPGGDCQGAAPCFGDIQQAVDSAADYATVKIAVGEYTGSGSQIVSINKPITLTGGFTTTDWDRYDPISNSTVLDAEHVVGRRGLAINGTGVSTITVAGLSIKGGYAQYSKGGGVYILDGTVSLVNNSIQDNSAEHGGGIYIVNGAVVLKDNDFLENSATLDGGGLYVGGGIVQVTGNRFTGNTAGRHGGGLSLLAGEVDQQGNTFQSNTANSGSAVAIAGGALMAANDMIAKNISPWDGVYVAGGSLTAVHWTMVGNSGYALTTYGGSARLTNTLVVSHSLAGIWGQDIHADTTLFSDNGMDCGGEAVCTNSLTGDPDFVAPASGNYHIGPDSAAIDAALYINETRDVDGDVRPNGEGCDIGADELADTYTVYFPIVRRDPQPVIPGNPKPFMVPIKKSGTLPIDFDNIEDEYTSEGYGLEYVKIGFHVGPSGGNMDGIGNWWRDLDSDGIPFFLKSVDNAGPLWEAQELMKVSGVPHILVYRTTRKPEDQYDVPRYDLEPEVAAAIHWEKHIAVWPPELDPSLVWIETINEVDKTKSEWLGKFAIATAQLALADGYKWAAFGFSGGEPESYQWESPSMLQFLQLAAQYPDRLAIALHEYSFEAEQNENLSMPITLEYPYRVGRFQFLFDVCDKHNISRPSVLITEWGWEYNDIPGKTVAMDDIAWASWLYSAYPQVLGAAIWYLGPGFGSIDDETQKLIAPLTEYARSHYFKVGLQEASINPGLFSTTGRISEDAGTVYNKREFLDRQADLKE
ncbi:MAG: right-handed parallel beta-helix repeat-containing protein [Anaerolineales bacterium]|nr:right-handed parallel beta-helix repeat-containing protein [Anaerolineales bacterium]